LLLLRRRRLQRVTRPILTAALLLATVLPAASLHGPVKVGPDRCFQSDLGDLDGQVAILPRHSDLLPFGWCRLDHGQTAGLAVTPSCPFELEAVALPEAKWSGDLVPFASSLVSLCCQLTI
jgi:hypothetical protein